MKSILKGYRLSCFHYITFLKWQKYKNVDQIGGGLGSRDAGSREMDITIKEHLVGDRNILYFAHMNLSILVVILYYGSTRGYHREKIPKA